MLQCFNGLNQESKEKVIGLICFVSTSQLVISTNDWSTRASRKTEEESVR